MATPTPDGNSPSKCTAIRTRSRFPKAKPNILDAGRRVGITLPTGIKSVASPASREEIRSPPPVRRVTRLDVIPPVLTPISSDTRTSTTTNLLASPPNTKLCTSVSLSTPPQTTSNSATVEADTEGLTPELASQPSQVSLPSLPQETTLGEQSQPSTLPSSSPVKKRSERKQITRRNNPCDKDEPRRRHVRIKGQNVPERGKMTMFDLIYWNPEDNPMRYEEDECRVPLSNKETNEQTTSTNAERLAEEAVDDPDFEEDNCPEGQNSNHQAPETDKEETMPVPQVKIGPDGNIILDEQSLVIETSASKKDLSSSPVVYERSSNVTYASFRNKKPSRNWSDKETTKFYMALSTVGTDFSMMGKLFPKRARNELKLKFKREERLNKTLVDKAIHDRQQYDLSLFEESDEETENLDAVSLTPRRTRLGRNKGKSSTHTKDKEAQHTAKKQMTSTRKSHNSRRRLQEQSDSDFEIEEPSSTTTDITSQSDTLMSDGITLANNSCDGTVAPDLPCEINSAEVNATEDSCANEDNESEVDEDMDGCNNILDGVLKQTRSGRHPKKRSPFTINVVEPKKRPRKENTKVNDDAGNAVSPLPQSLKLPSDTNASPGRIVNATINGSPGHLLVVENSNNGCQTVHLYMVSPPPSSKPLTGYTTPVAEHDYIKPSAQTETVIATLPNDSTCIEIANATLEPLDGVQLIIPQEVVYEEQLINTGEVH